MLTPRCSKDLGKANKQDSTRLFLGFPREVAGVREEFQTAFSRGSLAHLRSPRYSVFGRLPFGAGCLRAPLRFGRLSPTRLRRPFIPLTRRVGDGLESRHPGGPGRHAPSFSVTSKTKRCRPPGDDFSRRLQAAFKDWGLKLNLEAWVLGTPETGREATAYPAPAPRPSLSPRTCEGRERGPRGRGEIRNP